MAKAKLPKVSVLDRRLLHPFGSPSVAITLKEGGPWEIRLVNSTLRPGRIHDVRQNKGWEFVRASELDGTADEYGFRVVDDRLVRGEHGEEVLMKMPKDMYDQIQRAKAEKNYKDMGVKTLRDSVAQETAKEHGAQAGDAVFNAMKHSDVTTTRGQDLELEESA